MCVCVCVCMCLYVCFCPKVYGGQLERRSCAHPPRSSAISAAHTGVGKAQLILSYISFLFRHTSGCPDVRCSRLKISCKKNTGVCPDVHGALLVRLCQLNEAFRGRRRCHWRLHRLRVQKKMRKKQGGRRRYSCLLRRRLRVL